MKDNEGKSRLGSTRNDKLDKKLNPIVKKAIARAKGDFVGEGTLGGFPSLINKKRL